MNPRPLRVLQVVQRFYPELGGLETHVAEVTKRLAQTEDIEVSVLTTDRTGRLPRDEQVNGVRVLRVRSWRQDGEEYFAPGLVRIIRRGGWDLVHVQGSQTTVPTVAMLAARSARIPYVVTFHSGGHSSERHAPITAVQSRINSPLFRGAAALIAVSRFERTRFARITGLPVERFEVISNGGALPPVATGTAPEHGRIVTSGRLERYKGHHRVIAALPVIRRTVPEATLTVLGSGPYEPDLRRLADRAGVAEAVTFRHLLPAERGEMADVLARSSVMAALSDYEAHPVAVMEAVALGLPVVGADIAGIADLVEDGLVTGVPADADDDAVARALIEQLQRPSTGPHRAPEVVLPTWESCAEQVAAVYRRVVPQPSGGARVVQVITTLTTGGAERQVESLVSHSRHRHHVIALYGGGPVADSLTAAGHSVEVLQLAGLRRLAALPILAARLRVLQPDAVQVHLLSGQLWGLPAARVARVPVVVSTEHSLMDSSIENRPLTPSLRLLYLALNRLADRTVAVSAATAHRLERWGVAAARITVIDDGIDFERVAFSSDARSAVRAELGIAEGTLLVGAIGRLEAVKRFPQLLDALAPTLERGRRELLIAGDGPLRAALTRRAEELGVTDRVHLVGPRSDVPAVLSALDVLVSPSRDETFGMAVLEAIGAGLPVVHAQVPALDALDAQVPGSVRISSEDDVAEAAAIRSGVETARTTADGARLPVPEALVNAYDIRGTTARLDDLIDALRETKDRR